jgi:fructuronate reductase
VTGAATAAAALSRATGSAPAAPVRLVHLGLGNFFRAHQAWYTDRASDAAEWGIAAFTGRRGDLAAALAPQDGLYTLVTKAADGDRFDVITSLSRVHPADDHSAWLAHLRTPDVAVVTLTVTEAGYRRRPDGSLDTGAPDLAADVAVLRRDPAAPVRTVPARLVAGLLARAGSGAGRIAVVPCDNLSDNGAAVERVVRELAAEVSRDAVRAVDGAAFVTTMVDRITPRTTEEDRRAVAAATGADDRAPVVTEPFSEWVLSGEFPAGRPAWESAGARVVEDVAPFEQRKLRLLNGAHSLLAYAGSLRGHETVAGAVADPVCATWVQQWWDEASPGLPAEPDELAAYRSALLERFANPGIQHLLTQIAADGSQKVPVRILPVVRAARSDGRVPDGAVRVLAAWVLHLTGQGAPVTDPGAEALVRELDGDLEDGVRRVLGFLDPGLASDTELGAAVVAAAQALSP